MLVPTIRNILHNRLYFLYSAKLFEYNKRKMSNYIVKGEIKPGFEDILTSDALEFVASLHSKFNNKRLEILKEREKRQISINEGKMPSFLASTQHIRESSWKIAPLPDDLQRRRVEITGSTEAKMVINALNSGADCYMADFEDANSPTWHNQISGQINIKAAIRGDLTFKSPDKEYKLNPKVAVLFVRPRGWHLDDKHILINNERISASLMDFGLFFYHNAKVLIEKKSGPYFYLPKLESYQEARLWNDVFVFAQNALGLPGGTIKATVLIETLLAAFEMHEILYELRDHSAGLNAGRWDYIFSAIKCMQNHKSFCLADRSLITMEVPFMRSYALNLIKTCHHRNAPAIGGMSALIPIKNDRKANEIALEGVKKDKMRDAQDGYDGGWVAHPGLVSLAMDQFNKVLGDKPNQIDKKLDDLEISSSDLLQFGPSKPITEKGLRTNISVGIRYLSAWLKGNGCVPIFNLMEDAATCEISRAQVWKWINISAHLEDGRIIDNELVKKFIDQELDDINSANNDPYNVKAAKIFEDLSTNSKLASFLTNELYENL